MPLHLDLDHTASQPTELVVLLAEALGASPEGVVIHDRSGRIVAANSAAQGILGVTGPEMCGRTSTDPSWQTVRPDGTPFPGDEHPAAITLQTGCPVTDEIMGVHRPDGALRWLRITSWPLPPVMGGGTVAYFSDVTAARHLEQELATAQDRLAMAARAGAVGLWEWDLRDGRIWCDDGLAQILGLSEAPALPSLQRFLDRVHPDDRAEAAAHMEDIAAGRPPSDASYRIVREDGAIRNVLGQGQAVERDGDRLVRLAGAVIDVTESTAAAEAVLRHLEAMSDAYFAIDPQWRFTYLNSRASDLLGRRSDELIGRIIWDAFPDAVGTTFEHSYRRALQSGQPVAFTEYFGPLGRWFDVTASPSPDGLSVYFRDATDRRRAEDERERILASEQRARADAERAREVAAFAAAHDDLTGLSSRSALRSHLDEALCDERRAPIGVLFVDVDRFKLINDSAGHAEGDRALRAIAHRLQDIAGDRGMLARVGGDEFVIVTDGAHANAVDVGHEVVRAFQQPIQLHGQPHVITVSVGVAGADEDATTETLLRDADTALYRAKDDGGNRVRVFDDDLRTLVVRRLTLEQQLRAAISSSELRAQYQPIFDLASGTVDAVETLCRWTDQRLGPVSPSEFIPVAEETGLVIPLGRSMREGVRRDASALLQSTAPGSVAWVNVSMLELELPCTADHVIGLAGELADVGLRLGLEVTESLLCDDPGTLEVLHRLARAGVQIAIDDFGTGYSSLARLSRYPVDLLKIDQTFVAEIDDAATRSLVGAIVHMARAVGARTCAEGVETREQLEALRGLGVESASGHLLAPPSTIEHLRWAAHQGAAILSGVGRDGAPRRTGRLIASDGRIARNG